MNLFSFFHIINTFIEISNIIYECHWKSLFFFSLLLVKLLNKTFCRYLELESSGRKDEVRLHYVSQGNRRRIHTEVFAYALADGHWHAVALTLSGAQARLFVDCRLVYTRTLAAGPANTSFTGSPDLYVGQRNSGVHSMFKV